MERRAGLKRCDSLALASPGVVDTWAVVKIVPLEVA